MNPSKKKIDNLEYNEYKSLKPELNQNSDIPDIIECRHCRYYRRGQEETSDPELQKIRLYEKEYTIHYNAEDSSHALDIAMDEYERAGLWKFADNEDIPYSMKAYLYRCYRFDHEGSTVEDFKTWFQNIYL